MNGTVLKIVTQWDNFYKYDVLVKNTTQGIEFIGGYSAYIFQELSSMLNFTYTLHPEVGTYVFSKAEEFGIDMFVGSYGLFKFRAELADPTFVTGSSKVVAIIDHTFEESGSFSFLHPFKSSLWLAVLFFVVSLPWCFVILGIPEKYRVADLLHHGIALLLQKNTNIKLNGFPTRAMSMTVIFATLILSSTYNGSLISFLAVKVFTINSLETLLKSNYKILLERGYNDSNSAIKPILRFMNQEPLANLLLEKAFKSGFSFETYPEAIQRVGTSAVGMVIDEETAYEAVGGSRYIPCSWSTIPVLGIKYPWSMFVRKGTNFKHYINSGLLKLDERGFLKRGRKIHLPTGSECSSVNVVHSSLEFITMDQVLSAFFLYGFGILLAFLIFWIEQKLGNILNHVFHGIVKRRLK